MLPAWLLGLLLGGGYATLYVSIGRIIHIAANSCYKLLTGAWLADKADAG